jgi:hypothetical protein
MRYEEVIGNVEILFNEVKNMHFPELRNVQILILLDTKKCKSKGKLVLGRIKKATDVERYLTSDEMPVGTTGPEEGYDFIMFLDKNMTIHCADEDIKRIIRHELRHIFITETGKLTLIPHSLEDFYEEVDLNADDPRWAPRVAEMVSLIYEQGEDDNV